MLIIVLSIIAIVLIIVLLVIIHYRNSLIPVKPKPIPIPILISSTPVKPTSTPVKPKPKPIKPYTGPSLQSMATQLNKLQAELTATGPQPAYQVPPVDGGTLWSIADNYIKVIGKIQEMLPTGSINVLLPDGSTRVIKGNSSALGCQKNLIQKSFNGYTMSCPVYYWLGQSFNTAKTSLTNATITFTNTKSKKLLSTFPALDKNINDYITFIIDKYSA